MDLEFKRIFIVEDNVFNRFVYQYTLESAGARVEYDRHGRSTVSLLHSFEQFDLIILDLMLPFGRSGYSLFGEIRALPAYSTTPIIAISATEPGLAIPKLQELGFSGFIPKPIREDIFVRQILQVLNGEPIWVGSAIDLIR